MFARLLHMQVPADKIDEASKLFNESVVPMCRSQKGFKGAYFCADRKSGKGLPITLWETEEDMLASEENRFFQEQLVKFMGLFTAPPIREAYEILIEDKA